jgi:hypothetical protein
MKLARHVVAVQLLANASGCTEFGVVLEERPVAMATPSIAVVQTTAIVVPTSVGNRPSIKIS